MWLVQLRELLGFASVSNSNDQLRFLYDASNGVAEWELDAAVRQMLYAHLESSVSTLASLENIIRNLTNMVVTDTVQASVARAYTALEFSVARLRRGEYVNALENAQSAFVDSEAAFFDSKMLSLLYFPEEHKYAIYIPVFFPVLGQLIMSYWSELSGLFKRKK